MALKTAHQGETIICEVEVLDDGGNRQDPSTSMKISIVCPNGNDITDADMVSQETGRYYYDYQTTNCKKGEGEHKVTCVATHGNRISKAEETFEIL